MIEPNGEYSNHRWKWQMAYQRVRMIVQTKKFPEHNRWTTEASGCLSLALKLRFRRLVVFSNKICTKWYRLWCAASPCRCFLVGCARIGVRLARENFHMLHLQNFSSCEKHLFSRTPSPTQESQPRTRTTDHTHTKTDKIQRTNVKKIYRASLVQFSSSSTTQSNNSFAVYEIGLIINQMNWFNWKFKHQNRPKMQCGNGKRKSTDENLRKNDRNESHLCFHSFLR